MDCFGSALDYFGSTFHIYVDVDARDNGLVFHMYLDGMACVSNATPRYGSMESVR
jgi:hypothetical protein